MKSVIDSSILISLAKINYPEVILKHEGALLIPNAVYEESVVQGEERYIPDATVIKRFIADNKIPIIKIKGRSINTLFSRINKALPKGDEGVLALAFQEKALESLKDKIIKFQEFDKYVRSLILENRLTSVIPEFYIMEGKRYGKN